MNVDEVAKDMADDEIRELRMRLDNALAERGKAQEAAQLHRVEAAATQYRLEGVLLALRHVWTLGRDQEARK